MLGYQSSLNRKSKKSIAFFYLLWFDGNYLTTIKINFIISIGLENLYEEKEESQKSNPWTIYFMQYEVCPILRNFSS